MGGVFSFVLRLSDKSLNEIKGAIVKLNCRVFVVFLRHTTKA